MDKIELVIFDMDGLMFEMVRLSYENKEGQVKYETI